MQATADGEYVPSKELDTGFKIPKKRPNPEESSVTEALQPQVMEDSYYNYYNYAAQNYAAATADNTSNTIISPHQVDAARNLILQSLAKREYEKPKTYQNHILQDTIPDIFDDTLPRDLTTLFQPLYCKLCAAQLSSNVVAKLHYKSKNHEKKIRKYLIEYSEKTGEPLHKRAKIVPKVKQPQAQADDSNPLYYYCDVCDLPLTGKLHAESHYMGKNHRKATLGMKAPAGKGHYDETGRWVREGSSHKRPHESTTTSDNFGQVFRPEPPPVAPGFRCELCNITTTCKEQLDSHYTGQKHRKKLKQSYITGAPIAPVYTEQAYQVVMMPEPEKDCSSYRTPSGQYYCHICNCSSNSEPQFKQHLQSKKHLQKASQKKE